METRSSLMDGSQRPEEDNKQEDRRVLKETPT